MCLMDNSNDSPSSLAGAIRTDMLSFLAISGLRDGKRVDLLRLYEDGTVEIGDVPDASKEAMHILATQWREEMKIVSKDVGSIVAILSTLDADALVHVMEQLREKRCTNCGAQKREASCWCNRDSVPPTD